MRIALAQTNPTIGDIAGNTEHILARIDEARGRGAALVVFPELCVIGYPPKDLLLKPAVIERCERAAARIASHCTDIAAIIGYPLMSEKRRGRPLRNAAALCTDGRIVQTHFKSLLPTYDVFDESRYFEPGPAVDISRWNGRLLGISVCEDMWNDQAIFARPLYHDNPIEQLAAEGAELFINCAASPYELNKHEFRLRLLAHAASRFSLPVIYVSQVGGNDELIFDGASCVFDARGELIAHAKDFEEDLLLVDLPLGDEGESSGRIEKPRQDMASVYAALTLGVRDYCRKCGFRRIVLGLSGGIDSAVTACIAVAALGAGNVTGISMPSRYSSEGSKSDAEQLAETLGMTFHTIPIEAPHKAMEQLVTPYFLGREPDETEENFQARLRGIVLMGFSNKFGSLLVTTGNKSELAVGYCTLYGDMAGGFAVLSDVPKTLVYELANWINTPDCPLYQQLGGKPIPEHTITKPPSAELRPDQTDQDSLPSYDVLDTIIDRYVEREQSVRKIVEETGYDQELVERMVRLIDRNEYKRKQTPPGLKITGRAFGFGRRMPIAQRYDPNDAG